MIEIGGDSTVDKGEMWNNVQSGARLRDVRYEEKTEGREAAAVAGVGGCEGCESTPGWW